MYLQGTHGTSRSKADSIIDQQSFIPTGDNGHVGPGIYFWAIEGNDDRIARHLAQAWWKKYLDEERYKDDANTDFAVVKAHFIQPNEPEYCDASTQDFRNSVLSLAPSLSDPPKSFDVPTAIATVINKLEAAAGKKILVLKALVQTPQPKGFQSIVAFYYKMSDVYVIRQGGEKLIKKIELANP